MKRARGKLVKKRKPPPSTAFTVNGVEYHAETFTKKEDAIDAIARAMAFAVDAELASLLSGIPDNVTAPPMTVESFKAGLDAMGMAQRDYMGDGYHCVHPETFKRWVRDGIITQDGRFLGHRVPM